MIELPNLSELTFTESNHQYKLNEFIIPSVSEIMKPLSSAHYEKIDEETLNKAAERGTAVHEAVESYLLFGVEDINPCWQGYFNGFKEWIDSNDVVPVATEYRIYHKALAYAGTADCPCYVNGKLTIVDWKTTSVISKMLTRVQLEAYAKAFESHGIKFEQKIIVQATKDGKFREVVYGANDIESWKVFGELLDIHRYIKNNK